MTQSQTGLSFFFSLASLPFFVWVLDGRTFHCFRQPMSDSEGTDHSSSFEFESDVELDLEDDLNNLSLDTYRVTSLPAIIELQASLASRAADVTGLPTGVCTILLAAYNWDVAELSSAFLDDSNSCARRIRLRNADDFAKLTFGGGGGEGKGLDCPICLTRVKSADRASLGCHHAVCRNCFATHIKIQTIHDRKLYKTTCPGSLDCPLLVTSDTVKALAPDHVHQYNHLAAQLYVDSSPQFRHCPFPGCESIIEKTGSENLKAVNCNCGKTFCFECGLPYSHFAVPCDVAMRWLALVDHEHRSAKWVLENTKSCPRCQSKIERFDGCNHMSCGNCHFEFCWMCSQSWSEHSGKSYYNCVKYVPSKTETSISKKQAERILFYVLRYENHATLAAAVDDVSTREAHAMLAWAYVLLCTAAHSANQVLLEELVSDLVKAIEEASQLVRQRAQALHKFIMDTRWAIDQALVDKLIH